MTDSDTRRIEANVLSYARIRDLHEKFAEYVAHIVSECCDRSLIHKVEHRAKKLSSFERKCKKRHKDGELAGSLVYQDPLREITDFSGVRIIVYVKDYVDIVLSNIAEILAFLDKPEDVGERVYSQKGFGYQSKHVLTKLRDDRFSLKGNFEYKDLICEIQVRTILQHAWAEIEHDIQYKSEDEIPLSLRKRFSALAGLLEIGDNEFQVIQREGTNLREAIRSETIDALTKEGMESQDAIIDPDNKKISQNVEHVRNLVSGRRYDEAVILFDNKIEQEPTSLTLYVGRARVKFLLGDVSGALSDLNYADNLAGGDTLHTARLRSTILDGTAPNNASDPILRSFEQKEGQDRAKNALSKGDGVAALEEYLLLDQLGWNKAFSMYGKSLACAMEADTVQARQYLSQLSIRPGTIMAINIVALQCIIDIIDGKNNTETLSDLKSRLEYTPEYVLSMSPLYNFFDGLKARAEDYRPKAEEIRNLLSVRTI